MTEKNIFFSTKHRLRVRRVYSLSHKASNISSEYALIEFCEHFIMKYFIFLYHCSIKLDILSAQESTKYSFF